MDEYKYGTSGIVLLLKTFKKNYEEYYDHKEKICLHKLRGVKQSSIISSGFYIQYLNFL